MPSLPPEARLTAAIIPARARSVLRRLLVEQRPSMQVQTPTPSHWPTDAVTVSCLGHASVLISMFGTTLLTDPVLLDRVGVAVPGATVGPRRLTRPALDVAALPQLDAVCVSHAHADHFDRATLALLPKKSAELIVPIGCHDLISDLGFARVQEIAVGGALQVKDVTIRAVAVAHYGKRHALDRRQRGYHGYLFESRGVRVFFGGDTAMHVFSDEVVGAGVDVAVFGIGAYDPYVWNHATPEHAWHMSRQLRARHFVPMHHSTFVLSDEPVDEPLLRLLRVAGDEAHRVVGRRFGEAFTLPADRASP